MNGIYGKNVPTIQILQDLGKALYSSLMSKPTAIEKLHQSTCDRKENGYIDPKTGFYVLSAHYLSNRGHCCGAGCRHCPYPAEEQTRAGRKTISNPPENNSPT